METNTSVGTEKPKTGTQIDLEELIKICEEEQVKSNK
jgi:hypothetical protein